MKRKHTDGTPDSWRVAKKFGPAAVGDGRQNHLVQLDGAASSPPLGAARRVRRKHKEFGGALVILYEIDAPTTTEIEVLRRTATWQAMLCPECLHDWKQREYRSPIGPMSNSQPTE